MRIIGYVRLSRDHREESTSVERQREIIAKTCDARDFELVDTLDDVGLSATKTRLDRPGLDELRRRIAAGEADAVMVWRLDRLVRSVTDVGILLDEGLQIISATENLDTTTVMGRAMVEILQVFASMEAKTIGLRVTASRAHLRRVGRFPGGVVAYGYRPVPHPDGPGRALEPDPDETKVVRRMADAIMAGESPYAIAAALNGEGIPTRRGRKWSSTTVRSILRDGAILGRVREGTVKKDGRRVMGDFIRDPETGLPVSFWPPLLTVEEVEYIRALTDYVPTPGRGEQTSDGKRRKASRMLSGLLTCPGCKRNLVVRALRNSDRPALYVCGSNARGEKCPGGVTVECDRVEAEVSRLFLEAYGRLPVMEPRAHTGHIAGLVEVEAAIRETTDLLRDPLADLPALIDRLERLRARREALDSAPVTPVLQYVETGETFSDAWDALPVARRRATLIASGAAFGVTRAVRRGVWDPSRVWMEHGVEVADDVD